MSKDKGKNMVSDDTKNMPHTVFKHMPSDDSKTMSRDNSMNMSSSLSLSTTCLGGPFKWHAYIGHHISALSRVKKLCSKLSEHGITTYTRYVPGEPTASVVGRIHEGVYSCLKCIVLLTKNYEGSKTSKVEMGEIDRKAKRFNKDMIIVLRCPDLSYQDIPEQLKQYHPVEIDIESIESSTLVLELATKIKREPIAELSVLPKENIGYGSALGFFYGFLRLVLPDFRKRCEKVVEMHKQMKSKTVTKMLIILPTSCFAPPTMKEEGKIELVQDDSIVAANKVAEQKKDTTVYVTCFAHRAGNVARDYKSSLYKLIANKQTGEEYFFVGELATPLLTMYEMYHYNIVGLTKKQLYMERDVFYYTLQQVLSHPLNTLCNNQFKLLWWDDGRKADGSFRQPLYNFLLPILRDELQREQAELAVGAEHKSLSTDSSDSVYEETENVTAKPEKDETFVMLHNTHPTPRGFYECLDFDKYCMTRNPKGICLVINIMNFHNDIAVKENNLQTREGSQHDQEKMVKLFTDLDFDVKSESDLDLRTLEKLLVTWGVADHSMYDAFVCVIMTHGNLGEIFASDGKPMSVLDIFDQFSDEKCKSLKGKPKLFFIQACQKGSQVSSPSRFLPRGTQADTDCAQATDTHCAALTPDCADLTQDISLEEFMHVSPFTDKAEGQPAQEPAEHMLVQDAEVVLPLSDVGERNEPSTSAAGGEGSPNTSRRQYEVCIKVTDRACLVPGMPDFLISYSTLPGSLSYRDPGLGSLYISALDHQLRRNEEMDRALKNVSDEVEKNLARKRVLDNQKYSFQLPFHLTTGMSKILYLTSMK